MPAPDQIKRLVDQFHDSRADYRRGNYLEAQLRVEFLNPMLRALGWDVENAAGKPVGLREVIYEDKVTIGGKAKAPDYGFAIDGRRRFFLEAKKPSVDLEHHSDPAYQLRRYAWTAKLPLSVLTDFEEFAVYDTRLRPKADDAPAVARLRYLRYSDYLTAWDEIEATFGRAAVAAGALEQYAEAHGGKKGIAPVDAEFLKQLNEWRDLLARAVANRNPGLSTRDLNFAVQQTLDRIIFLRIAEDRGIEPYGQLRELAQGAGVFDRLIALFVRADARYNSGLFHFGQEKGRGAPDLLTPRLNIDDRPLKDILRALYEPLSPYEFSVFPADILGQVYEQFLGQVIRLTPAGRAVVEEKPEVRKAGGVYYTPTYIVDYIVRQTVGRLVAGHTPDPSGPVSRLRVLDPACGSGSFLLGAYQFLLNWHLQGYLQDAKKWSRRRGGTLLALGNGDYALTLAERKRILLANLYGVDIDPQAVEVTKLSLLLKVLEGAKDELSGQMALLPERALPDLDSNVKCGNSLIGPDFYDRPQPSLLADDELLRVNAFDWRGEFPDAMRAGGFDAVIGNPPYIRIQALKEWAPLEVELYKQLYRAGSKGNYDIYVVFVEKGLSLLNERGRLGFILPHKFFNAKYGEPLRGLIAEGRHLSQIVHFGDQQVFAGATTYTCLLLLRKQPKDNFVLVQVDDLEGWRQEGAARSEVLSVTKATSSDWNFVIGSGEVLHERLRMWPTKLGDVAARMGQGVRTSANEVFVLDLEGEANGGLITATSRQLGQTVTLEQESVLHFLQGREIKPYRVLHSGKILVFPYEVSGSKATLLPEKALAAKYPNTYRYLSANKRYLENREKGKMRGPSWYAYGRHQNIDLMSVPKILVPDIADRAAFAFDGEGRFAFTSGYGIVFRQEIKENPLYFLALLNSRLLDRFLKQVSTTLRGGFFRYFTQYIEQLPIRTIDFTNPQDAARHDEMVALVTRMLELHRKLAAERNPQVKTLVQRQIEATDRQIDRLVYELYGLTEEEIAIVEGAA